MGHAADLHQYQRQDQRDRRAAGRLTQQPYTAFVGGAPFPYNGAFVTGGGIFGVAQDFKWAHAYQTNVGIQRQIGRALSVGAAYVGTFNRNLPFGRDVNYPVVTPTATSAGANILSRRPNPAYGAVLLLDSDQRSSYNALQVTGALRAWHHITVDGFYTLQQDHDQRGAAQQHHAGPGPELQQSE